MSKAKKQQPVPTARRMSDYRARMRASGLRQVQLWLPDTKSPAFIKAAQQQSLAIAKHDPAGDEMLRWIEATYEWPPE